METLVLIIHVIVCVLLVIIVLLQSGKGADLAGAFGMMGSQSSFGPRGTASILSKMTTTFAIMFMLTSLTLWIIGANKASSKIDSIISSDDAKKVQKTNVPKTTPTVPAPVQTQPSVVPPATDNKSAQPANVPAEKKADKPGTTSPAETPKSPEKK